MGENSITNSLDFQTMMHPIPLRAKLSNDDYFIWGASMVKGKEGNYHLFYSRWPKSKGFQAWVTDSEIAHAVAKDSLGPYHFVDVALPARGKKYWDGLCTHNPTVHKFDNKYYLYYMGNTGNGVNTEGLNWIHRNNQRIGVAVSNSPNGPWKRFNKPLIDTSPDSTAMDALCVSNPSITPRPDGGYLMVYKAVGKKRKLPFGGPVVHMVATSQNPTGPFKKYDKPIFTVKNSDFPAEDPSIWWEGGNYWAIIKDQHGAFTGAGRSLALFKSSDGFTWNVADYPLVSKLNIHWADGNVQKLNSLERPQIWLDEKGEPKILFLAATMDRKTNSFNVHIPLK